MEILLPGPDAPVRLTLVQATPAGPFAAPVGRCTATLEGSGLRAATTVGLLGEAAAFVHFFEALAAGTERRWTAPDGTLALHATAAPDGTTAVEIRLRNLTAGRWTARATLHLEAAQLPRLARRIAAFVQPGPAQA